VSTCYFLILEGSGESGINFLFIYSIQDQCFYQLRTIQQLGYVAFCRNRVNEGVGSFEVSTSSANDYHDE